MIDLYADKDDNGTSKIENLLPKKNDESEFKRCADKIEMYLQKFMAENGGDYDIISTYISNQIKNSWFEESKLLKGFYLDQRANLDEDRFYFLKGKDDRGRRAYIEKFHEQYPIGSIEYDKYFKTMAMYQAFNAVALNHMDWIEELDKKSGTLEVGRHTTRRYTPGQPQGIADSTFFKDTSYSGYYKIKMKVPICDIRFMYFLSPEILRPGFLTPQHEIVCDMTHAQIEDKTVLKKIKRVMVESIEGAGRVNMDIESIVNIGDSKHTDRIKAYLEQPYLVELGEGESKKQAVFLHDKYHFWEDHVSMEIDGKKYPGYTDDPRIIEIAKKAGGR